jgi:very-short-patch-repair endonuclease
MARKKSFEAGGMFEGAPPQNFKFAKALRENMTAGEMALWLHLRYGIDGLKFRRQHPIASYIADFYCHKVKLIIEIDGYIHNDPVVKQKDEFRETTLVNMGNTIIRFKNRQVLDNMIEVLGIIRAKIQEILAEKNK